MRGGGLAGEGEVHRLSCSLLAAGHQVRVGPQREAGVSVTEVGRITPGYSPPRRADPGLPMPKAVHAVLPRGLKTGRKQRGFQTRLLM